MAESKSPKVLPTASFKPSPEAVSDLVWGVFDPSHIGGDEMLMQRLIEWCQRDGVVAALLAEAVLHEIDRAVIVLRFGLHDGVRRTYDEVGEEIGFSRTRANQRCDRGLHQLRIPGQSKLRDEHDRLRDETQQ